MTSEHWPVHRAEKESENENIYTVTLGTHTYVFFFLEWVGAVGEGRP